MAKIIIDIKNCKKCPHLKITDTYSSDSWDRMDDWHCSKENKKIQGAVEWWEEDKIKIPNWCPIKV